MQEIRNETVKDANHAEVKEATQYLITEENYQLLRKLQSEVFKEIQMSPSVRKVVNELITEENLDKVKNKFINLLK